MLQGIRVLDLTWVLGGPFAGQLLAQLGADVIKVEAPTGDSSRGFPPVWFEDDSSFFLSVNRGKRSVCLDLKHPDGKAAFDDLVRHSDVVMYGFTPGVPRRLGIDFDSLRAINPRICVGQLIGLHDRDGYADKPAFDLVIQALGGVMGITGHPGQPPVRVGYQIADLAAGLYLALGTAGALVHAARTGEGRSVQVSLLDCQLALLTWQAQNHLISGEVPQPNGSRHHMLAPSEAFLGADGRFFVISPTGQRFWATFCDAIARPDLVTDERFATPDDRIAHVQELADELGAIFRTRPAQDWLTDLEGARIPAAPVLNVEEALNQPLALLRGMVETVPHPAGEASVRMLGNPFKIQPDPPSPLNYPPALGQDTVAVLTEVCGYSADQIDRLLHARAAFAASDDVGCDSPETTMAASAAKATTIGER